MYAIFRLIPVTLTLAGIAGFVLSVGMAVDANILIFERMKEELRLGKSLPAAVEAGFNRAWNSILDSNVSSLITATILYAFGSSVIRGFALVLIIGVLVSMFSAIVVTRTILRWVVRQEWARKPSLYGLRDDEFVALGRRPPVQLDARRARVFDVIGKRRWFYLFSLIITIPGLVFILLTPFTDAGLQFTIDYTGGTSGRSASRTRASPPTRSRRSSPSRASRRSAVKHRVRVHRDQDRAAGRPPAAEASPSASAVRRPRAARPAPAPSPAPRPPRARVAAAERQPGPERERRPRRRRGSPAPSRLARRRRRVPRPSPAAPTGNTEIPTEGKLGEVAAALQEELGPIAEQRSLTTIGAVVSSDLISQALILIVVGSLGIMAWITYRFRDVEVRRDRARLAAPRRHRRGRHVRDPRHVLPRRDRRAVRDRDADRHRLQRPRHDRRLRPVRENKARHAGEPFEAIVNHSILQTFGRSIMTSLTVVLTLLALLLFGGAAISDFVLALLIGIVSGTYSSIFVASPLLVDWQLWDDRRHGRLDRARSPAGPAHGVLRSATHAGR